jgi:fucose permease
MTFRERLALAGCFITEFLLGVSVSILGPSLPGIAGRTGVSLTQAGILFTLFAGGSLLATLSLAWLVDRPLRHGLLAGGSLLMAVTLWLFAASSGLAGAGVTIAMAGLAMSGTGTVPNVLLAEWYGKRAPAMLNILHMVAATGSFCGPLAVGLATRAGVGYAAVFVGLGVLEALAGLLWLFARPPRPEHHADAPRFSISLVRPVMLLILFILLYVGSEQTVGGWTYSYARETGTADAALAGAATSLFWLAMIGGRLAGSRILRRVECLPLLGACVLIGAAGVAIALLARSWIGFLWLGIGLAGLAFGPVFPTTMAFGVQRQPERMGMVSSLLVAAGSFGAMSLPAAAGALIPITGVRGTIASVEAPLAIMLLCLWGLSARRTRAGTQRAPDAG